MDFKLGDFGIQTACWGRKPADMSRALSVVDLRVGVLAAVAGGPDITIEERDQLLADRGHIFRFSTIQRFFQWQAITRKKAAYATEHDSPDILRQRRTKFEGQIDLDPKRPVFIDET